jgi:hypothetical protein
MLVPSVMTSSPPFETDVVMGYRLALQLLFCFEVRALGGGLVSSTPE